MSLSYKTVKILGSIVIILAFTSNLLDARAGRGGSYRSSSSSSSSSSSGYSGSSSSGSYSTSSGSYSGSSSSSTGSYSGSSSGGGSFIPEKDYLLELNMKRYMTWLELNPDGSIEISEKFELKEIPDEDGFKRELDFLPNEIHIPSTSVTATGDVSDIEFNDYGIPQFEIEFKQPSSTEDGLTFTLYYTVKNAFQQRNSQNILRWPFKLPGRADAVYFQIDLEDSLNTRDNIEKIEVQFGNFYDILPIDKNDKADLWRDALPGELNREKNGKYFWAENAKNTGFDVIVSLPGDAIPVYEKTYENDYYAISHEQANYNIEIFTDSTLKIDGDLKLKNLTKGKFIPRLLMPSRVVKTDIDMEGSIKDNFIETIVYENLAPDKTDYYNKENGITYEFNKSLNPGSADNFQFSYLVHKGFENTGNNKIYKIDLPAAVMTSIMASTVEDAFDFDFGDENNALIKKTNVTVKTPEGIKLNKNNLDIYTGSYGMMGSTFEYARKLDISIEEVSANTYRVILNEPVKIASRYRLHLTMPGSVVSSDGTMAYYKSFLLGRLNDSPWLFYLVAILVLAVIILVPVIIFSIKKSKQKQKALQENKAREKQQQLLEHNQKIAEKIKLGDPEFSLQHFLTRVERTSGLIQDGWSQNNMNLARSYISQGIYNRFRLQLKLMIEEEQLRNYVSDYQVLEMKLEYYTEAAEYQTIHVKIKDSARDITISSKATAEQVKEKLNEADASEFTQIYSFTRKRSAKTDSSKSFLNGQCPSCGAAVENATDTNKCRYCGNLFNSGEYDWVLTEITQLSEWRRPAEQPQGFAYNVQVAEDRASYLFWQWLFARAKGNAAVVKRHAAHSFMQNFKPQPQFFSEPVVGAVDLEKMGKIQEGITGADVLIKYSVSEQKGHQPANRHLKMRMVIKQENDDKDGFAGGGCPTCSAPLPDDDSPTCDYCSSALPKKEGDWLIYKISEE